MSEGTQPQSATELPQETLEIIETREQLDRATTDPEAEMERTGDLQQAEDVQEAYVAVVEAAPIRNEIQEMIPVGYEEDDFRETIQDKKSNHIDKANKEAEKKEDAANNYPF